MPSGAAKRFWYSFYEFFGTAQNKRFPGGREAEGFLFPQRSGLAGKRIPPEQMYGQSLALPPAGAPALSSRRRAGCQGKRCKQILSGGFDMKKVIVQDNQRGFFLKMGGMNGF